jgi:GT2 family glycosyltransferase
VNAAIVFLGAPNLASLRVLPRDLPMRECAPGEALDVARGLEAKHLLIVEPEAYAGVQTFTTARTLDANGGILGGCASMGNGSRRYGGVFAAQPFGPYAVEPFPLIDPQDANASEQPPPDAVDTVCPGIYIVDRQAFIEADGFDATLGSPWRVYDLCMRMRESGKAVRWTPHLKFSIDVGIVPCSDPADHRDFMRRWGRKLASRFDLHTPARGAIRRTLRLPHGQREILTIALPPTEIVLYGRGDTTPSIIRSATNLPRVRVRDARGEESTGLAAMRESLRMRSESYVAFVSARDALDESRLARMLVELEANPKLRGIREEGSAVVALARLPLDLAPPENVSSVSEAVDVLLAYRKPAGKNVSVVYVAHSKLDVQRTSFEAVYGDIHVDYHVVVTSSQPDSITFLRSHPTLHVTVDETEGLADGVNTALTRTSGDIVVLVSDDFCPPPGWLDVIRDAFALRPEMGILGLSAVFTPGPQCVDLAYADMSAFKKVAQRRRATLARDARLCDRLTGLAVAVDARVFASVGGFDPKLGVGRWGVEDLTVRIRAAGYAAYVADDVFVHRFDPETAEPFVTDPKKEHRRAAIFAHKWKVRTGEFSDSDARAAIARGFDPSRHFVPLAESIA